MRGEYIKGANYFSFQSGSPPHARGILFGFWSTPFGSGITPACAGNTRKEVPGRVLFWDHPRMRGEYLDHSRKILLISGSPPHARGIQEREHQPGEEPGITPACAGNTRSWIPPSLTGWDHPRMRGEYSGWLMVSSHAPGSPPHARGIRRRNRWVHKCAGITPACAGNTQTKKLKSIEDGDHPRMRGEYPLI